jgi:hypothetical protein
MENPPKSHAGMEDGRTFRIFNPFLPIGRLDTLEIATRVPLETHPTPAFLASNENKIMDSMMWLAKVMPTQR